MPPKRKAPPTKGGPKAKQAKTTKGKPAAKKPGPKAKPEAKKAPAPRGRPKTKALVAKAAVVARKAQSPTKTTPKAKPVAKKPAAKVTPKKPVGRPRSVSPVKKPAAKAGPGRPKSVPAKATKVMRSPPPVKRVTAVPKKAAAAAAVKKAGATLKKLNFPKIKPLRPRENTPPRKTGRGSKPSTPKKTPEKRGRSGSPRGSPKGSPRSPGRPSKSPSTTPTKQPTPVITPGKKIFACSICEQIFHTSFDLWTHKKDIHENPPLMSPEKAMEVLAAAERRRVEQEQAAKATKRKLEMAAKEPVAVKKTKVVAVTAKEKAVAAKDKAVAKAVENLDAEVDSISKREQIEQLKTKVMALRKEAGKPGPNVAAKKKSAAEAQKGVEKLMAEVEKVLSNQPKKSRGEVTVKEKLDLMETELDLELRRMKQASVAAAKDTNTKVGTSLGPKTAAIKIANNPPPKPMTQGRPPRRESGEISFKEEGEISYQSETPINLEPGEIYLGPGASSPAPAKTQAVKVQKPAVQPAGPLKVISLSGAATPIAPSRVLVKAVPKQQVGKASQIIVATTKTPQLKPGLKVIGTVKVSPAAKVHAVTKSPPAKVAAEPRHIGDAIPELSLNANVAAGVKTLVKYKCANTTCDQYFTDYEKLRKHEEACAQVDNHSSGTFTCAECGLCFNSQLMLTRHKNQKFGCAATNKRMLPAATKPAQPTVTAMVSCKTCDRFFANTANMHQHARHCTGPVKQRKDSKCPICNKAFTSVRALQDHCLADHNFSAAQQVLATGRNKYVPAKGVTCLDCGEWFQARLELIQHKRKCGKEGFAKESFPCMICKAKCYTRVSLYDHMKSAHGDDEATYKWLTFSCTACKMIFESEIELEKHRKKKHNMTGSSSGPVQAGAVPVAAKAGAGVAGNKVMIPVEVVKKAQQAAKEGKPVILDLSQAVTVDAETLRQSTEGSQGKKEIMVPTQGGDKAAPMMILDLAKLQQMVSSGQGQVFVPQSVAKQISAKKAAAEWNKERAAPEATVTSEEPPQPPPAKVAKTIVIQPITKSPPAQVTTVQATTSAAAAAAAGTPKHKPAILRASPAAKTVTVAQAAVAATGKEEPPVRMLKPIDKTRMMCMTCNRVLNSMNDIATHSCLQKTAVANSSETGEIQWK